MHQKHIHNIPGEQQTAAVQTAIWEILHQIPDPEVPVLSITDLGIVRDVQVSGTGITIAITPTYSGCPAMDMISMSIKMELLAKGFENISVIEILSPAWTTEWMSEAGKIKLKEYGIAPPPSLKNRGEKSLFEPPPPVQCPRCNSYATKLVSEFSSTACKAFYQCENCQEPFDNFKCH